MKLEIKQLTIVLDNNNHLVLTPLLWNEFKYNKKDDEYYLIKGRCEKNEKEFIKRMKTYGLVIK